ncbi:MAG: hypothetical protein O3B41_08215 [Bacteroidetes bacterium]|nr:hypothetical protein [Bacteroidota bacterium]
MKSNYLLFRSAWIAIFMLTLASCGPLEPLGEEDLADDLSSGTKIGTPTSVIKSDTWNLSYIGRVQIPAGDIDPLNLDGRVPDVVNFETEAATITRYRVVNWGRLQLKDNGYFQFILQYSRFAVRSGADIGPTAACNADIRGVYGLRDGTIILYPERFSTERIVLQLDALGSLRSLEMPTHCTGVESGAPFESNILLSNIVMNAVQ